MDKNTSIKISKILESTLIAEIGPFIITEEGLIQTKEALYEISFDNDGRIILEEQ